MSSGANTERAKNSFVSFFRLRPLLVHDIAIIATMAILAGCGLIYEYLLSHYAGRVLGSMEPTIYAMIGVMIVSMGLGSLTARKIGCEFTGFAWLEVSIALVGTSSILVIACAISFANLLPQLIGVTYMLPPDLYPTGGIISAINQFARSVPFIMGFVLGFMIGIEIPLIARVRESLYGAHLKHNVGTIYGADYIGAGVGAALWVSFMMTTDITRVAVLTATANLLVGLVFYFRYRRHIRYDALLLFAHLIVFVFIMIIARFGVVWEYQLEDMLYKDKVIHSMHTQYQHVTITKRLIGGVTAPVYALYINGRLQFSSSDEQIYHSMLVTPAMLASARHDKILIIGGGDGLALRDVLRWNPKAVTLLDLDRELVDFFSKPKSVNGKIINQPLLELNQHALQDARVNIVVGDAFKTVDALVNDKSRFDTIIVDLPDPSHPDLNKLYSVRFYSKLSHLLMGDGAIAIQSTSPYHAKEAFLSIGRTVKFAGFLHVEQYHQNVPSFGEWGWTIATKNGKTPKQRLRNLTRLPVQDPWLTQNLLLAAFEFPVNFYEHIKDININRLGSHIVYQYHHQGWQKQQGIYITDH